jgi:hypothetical protein
MNECAAQVALKTEAAAPFAAAFFVCSARALRALSAN